MGPPSSEDVLDHLFAAYPLLLKVWRQALIAALALDEARILAPAKPWRHDDLVSSSNHLTHVRSRSFW